MAKDDLIPIVIIIGIVLAIALLGSQGGFFAIFRDVRDVQIEALGHTWKGTNIGTDQTDERTLMNTLSGDITKLSIYNEANPIRTTSRIETSMTLTLSDVNVKELDGLKIFSTTSGSGAANGGASIRLSLVDELGNEVQLASTAGGYARARSSWGFGGFILEVGRDKKTVTSFIGDSVALQSDVSALTGNSWNLKLGFSIGADGSFGGATQNTQMTLVRIEKFAAAIPAPSFKPAPKATSSYLAKIQSSTKALYGLQSVFAVVGPSSILTGEATSFEATRSVVVDNDYSDGTYTYQYADWILTDNDGNILLEGTWEEIPNGVYAKSFSITANQPGNYALAAIVQQFVMNYNPSTGQWAVISEDLIYDNSPLKLKVTSLQIPLAPTPTPTEEAAPVIVTDTTSTEGVPSASIPSPTITSLEPEQIPEQKEVSIKPKITLILAVVVFAGLVAYMIFQK